MLGDGICIWDPDTVCCGSKFVNFTIMVKKHFKFGETAQDVETISTKNSEKQGVEANHSTKQVLQTGHPGHSHKQKTKASVRSNKTFKRPKLVSFDSDDESQPPKKHHQGVKYKQICEQRARLPIFACKQDLVAQIKSHNTTIVLAETGSGKSTQVPQYLLEADMSESIAVTQPRRVAAVSLATRVAQEMNQHVGHTVGYSVRFDTRASPKETRIKYLTDGMLLRELMIDPDLKKYSTVVLDEAHERTVTTDLLMGLLKALQQKRAGQPKPLRIIVMSATIDAEKFSEFFGGAKILYVPGKTYPVQRMYLKNATDDVVDTCVSAVCHINRSEATGDILVFLAGQEEIDRAVHQVNYIQELMDEAAHKALKKHKGKNDSKKGADAADAPSEEPSIADKAPIMKAVPLYASLAPHKQKKAFEMCPPGQRKIVFATNIAETSVTIPGVRYVVDSGLRKVKVWRSALGLDSLLACPVSQASANQRTGRAGREAPGKCFRMYPESEYTRLQSQTEPEILRCDLSATVLALKCAGVSDIQQFAWVDAPSRDSLAAALVKLHALRALDDRGNPTELGKRMSVLPISPQQAAVLLAAVDCDDSVVLEAVLCVVACLSVQDILLSPPSVDLREEINAARRQQCPQGSVYGDLVMLYELYAAFRQLDERAGEHKPWCKTLCLSMRSLTNVSLVIKQLAGYLRIPVPQERLGHLTDSQCESVVQCFLKGFSANTALGLPDRRYKALSNSSELVIHPSSVMFGRKEPAIMFIDYVYTTKAYARVVSPIQPEWLAV